MKKTLLLVIIAVVPILLQAQFLQSKTLYAGYWGPKTIVKLSTPDSSYQIELLALAKRIKGTSKRIRPIRVNDKTYRLIRTEGVVHIQNEAEEALLMTSNRQMKAVLANGEFFRKNRNNRRHFTYLNQAGKPVIEARLRNNVFNHVIEITLHEDQPLLLALCTAMLVKTAREDIWLAM